MPQSKNLLLFQQINEFTNLAESFGVSIEYGSNFKFFCNIPKQQPQRHHVNPAFDPQHSDLNSDNAFWMIGHNKSGEIVHTQAIKLLDLCDIMLEEYLFHRIWDLRPYGYKFDPEKTTWHLTPSASKITGQVTYHGELWSKGGPDGVRGGCLTVLLTRLMLLMGLMKWSPDFLFGFQSPMTTCRGLAAREGYMRMEQRSILWYQQNSSIPMEDWLVWMDRKDAEFNLRLPAKFFYDLFEKSSQAEVTPQDKVSKFA